MKEELGGAASASRAGKWRKASPDAN